MPVPPELLEFAKRDFSKLVAGNLSPEAYSQKSYFGTFESQILDNYYVSGDVNDLEDIVSKL